MIFLEKYIEKGLYVKLSVKRESFILTTEYLMLQWVVFLNLTILNLAPETIMQRILYLYVDYKTIDILRM